MFEGYYTETVDDAVIAAFTKLMAYAATEYDIAEQMLYSAVILCEGCGGFLDFERSLQYFDVVVGSAREEKQQIASELSLLVDRIPEPGEQIVLEDKYLLYGMKNLIVGVIEPDRFAGIDKIQTIVNIGYHTLQRVGQVKKFKQIYKVDKLTGIKNVAAFTEELKSVVIFYEKYKKSVTFMYIDLNNFKAVNDVLGHSMGDRVLQSMAHEIKKVVKSIGTVYRLGGDEFCVVIKGMTKEQCERYARQIQGIVHQAPGGIEVTASIGLSTLDNGRNIEVILKEAEQKMYEMKLKERRKKPRGNQVELPLWVNN